MQEEPLESEHTVECSGRTILECSCGERLILLGLQEDWSSEQRTDFDCPCGKALNLSNRLDEEVLAFRRLMKSALKVPGS
jgi:hypothetical protein